MEDIKNKFPNCYPQNIVEEILKVSIERDIENVYRVARNGELNEEAFYSTYQMVANKMRKKLLIDDENSIEYYSTSCNNSAEARIINKLLTKPKSILLIGNIKKERGRTDTFSESGHLNWWIYKDANPVKDFRKYE